MSQVKISGNASGAGIFEITSPNSATNRTLTLPDATGTVVLDSATQSFTNKSFNSASFVTVSGTAPLYAARAWVNFNGTGTPAIRASGNVSSITDNGTGDYTVNFTTAMPDANYAVASSGQLDNAGAANGDVITGAYRSATSHTTSGYRTSTVNSGGTAIDPVSYELAVFC
jgi:hypothetical protein